MVRHKTIKQTALAMMEKLTRNIMNNKSNKFRCNFTIGCDEQPLKFPISPCHCSILTGIIS